MSKLAAALSVIYQIICNGGVSRVAGTKICCHRRGTNDEDDGLDRWAATGCAKGGGGDDGGLDFLEDTEFPEATDFKASVLMLIQKEFRTTNKKLFKILVEDKNQALRSDLGSHDIQSTFNVAMDEFLCNSEIKSLVQDNLGNHFDMNIHEKVLFKKRLPGRDLHEYEFLN